jgi:hypothetical protein
MKQKKQENMACVTYRGNSLVDIGRLSALCVSDSGFAVFYEFFSHDSS